MVKVREDHPETSDGRVDIDLWLSRIKAMLPLSTADSELLRRACELSFDAEQKAIAAENIWAEGASSFRTGLEMAEILADLQLDCDSLVAAVLYRRCVRGV